LGRGNDHLSRKRVDTGADAKRPVRMLCVGEKPTGFDPMKAPAATEPLPKKPAPKGGVVRGAVGAAVGSLDGEMGEGAQRGPQSVLQSAACGRDDKGGRKPRLNSSRPKNSRPNTPTREVNMIVHTERAWKVRDIQ